MRYETATEVRLGKVNRTLEDAANIVLSGGYPATGWS